MNYLNYYKMKKLNLSIIALLFLSIFSHAQTTADEILKNYFENIGGVEKLSNLKSLKMTASLNQGGMEIPVTIYRTKDGKQALEISFQGMSFKQGVFDGETLWGTNQMTMKPEKMDKEATENMKLEINDFPDPFLNYKEKGYTVELIGKEDFQGTETFKIKLVTEPITVDGKKEDSVSYYFFDTENFVPIAMQTEIKSGQAKGMMSETLFSDYQEVDGLYFPYSLTMGGVKGQPGAPIKITKIEVNSKIDDAMFAFPKEEVAKPAAATKE